MFALSIIIPVYNVAPYIERCLRSVTDQSYTGSVECLIVDDGCQDESIRIAEQILADYRGDIEFRIIHHPQNLGPSAARNTGIRESLGKYIYFLDSDDYIEPFCLSQLMSLVQKYPEAEMIQAGAIAPSEHQTLGLSLCKSSLPEVVSGNERIRKYILRRFSFPVTAWNRLVRRDFLLHHQLFFREGILHEDELWTFQLARHLSFMSILKQDVYHYVYRDNGIMGTNSESRADSLIAVARQMVAEVDDVCREFTTDYIRHFIHLYSFDIHCETKRQAMLDCSLLLSDLCGWWQRLFMRAWVKLAKLDIRKHWLLYSVLYHTA